MTAETPNPEHLDQARRRAGARLGFVIHLSVYIAVMILLIILNLTMTPDTKWFVWPLLGWGLGLLGHAAGIFIFPGMLRRMTDQELEKIKRDAK